MFLYSGRACPQASQTRFDRVKTKASQPVAPGANFRRFRCFFDFIDLLQNFQLIL